jgi:phosphatidylinositol dimannoside acyltransferase
MSALKDVFLYIYWKPFKCLIQKTPPALFYPAGSCLGSAAFLCRRGKRRILQKEAEFVLGPATSARQKKLIVRKAFQIEAQKELEVLLFPILSPKNISSYARIEGIEHLDNALARGKGAMLLFAHLGANQMIMPAIGHRGFAMCQLSAPATIWKEMLPDKKFSAMEEYSLQARADHEEKLPVKHINIFKSVKEAFRCLQRNEVLGVAVDGGGGKERLSVSFLGREALLSPGPAEISIRTGCAVLPAFVLRDSKGINRVIVENALEIPPDSDAENAAAAITQAFATRLQEYVEQHPEYYINFMALRTFMAQRGDVPLFKNSSS